jgi:single-stranded-DNA-specific exonuclease
LAGVTPGLWESLVRLEPFGQGNPEPVFASQEVSLMLAPRVVKDRHIKLVVKQKSPDGKNSFTYQAVGWRMADRLQAEPYLPGDPLDLAFTIGVNSHPDFGGLELTLEDFRRAVPAKVPVCS